MVIAKREYLLAAYEQHVVRRDDWRKELRSFPALERKMVAKIDSWFYDATVTSTGTGQTVNFFTRDNSTGASLTNDWTTDISYADLRAKRTLINNPVYTPPPQRPQKTPKLDPRILNKYLNASDLLEEFILEMKPLGIRQNEVLSVPIELFINWLIIRSAEEDGLDAPALPRLPDKRRDRCWDCGKFITLRQRQTGMFFCSGAHFDRYAVREAA